MPGTLIFLILRPLSENVQNRAIHISPVAQIRPEPSEALSRVPKQASKRGFLGGCGAWPGPGAEFVVKMNVWPRPGADLLVKMDGVFESTELKGFVKLTFEFRERHFDERNGGPSKCSWWRRAGKQPQNIKVMMQD